MSYRITWRYGHYEVYRNGVFCFSADTYEEAKREIEEDRNDCYSI